MREELGQLIGNSRPCPDLRRRARSPGGAGGAVGGQAIAGRDLALSSGLCATWLALLRAQENSTPQQAEIADADPARRSASGSAFLVNVGLDYLTLDRAAGTLSGGEAQRIRLATQIGSGLVGVLYVLDEPRIGLHQRDNDAAARAR